MGKKNLIFALVFYRTTDPARPQVEYAFNMTFAALKNMHKNDVTIFEVCL